MSGWGGVRVMSVVWAYRSVTDGQIVFLSRLRLSQDPTLSR